MNLVSTTQTAKASFFKNNRRRPLHRCYPRELAEQILNTPNDVFLTVQFMKTYNGLMATSVKIGINEGGGNV